MIFFYNETDDDDQRLSIFAEDCEIEMQIIKKAVEEEID